ncbi:LytR family transcriptional regulator [Candidatus Microgenomates bacterium]|nr:MAG: LytR family transcriptional regulator [Candidatus Microgenomates bacterium]
MQRKKKNIVNNNLKIAITFCVLVFFLIIISLFFKVAAIFQNSRFDGAHSFNLVIYDQKNALKRNEVISFSPDKEEIAILDLVGDIKYTEVGKTLEIPVDGLIGVENEDFYQIGKGKALDKFFGEIVFRKKNIKTDLTIIDLAKLWFFTRSVPEGMIGYKQFSINSNDLESSESLIDKIANQYFNDNSIFQEKYSIQIVNGTDVFGFGNRLARLVTNIGGNVVSVSSSDKVLENSEIIYSGNNSYTAKRLNKILNFKISKAKDLQSMDIIIKIGKDKLSSQIF